MSEFPTNRGDRQIESTPGRLARVGAILASTAGIIFNSGNATADTLPELPENTVTVSINGTWNGHSKDPLATGNVPIPQTGQQLYVDHPGEPAIIGDMAGTLRIGEENYVNTLNSLGPDTKVIRVDYSEGATIARGVDSPQVIAHYSIANPYDQNGGVLRQFPILTTIIGIDGPEVIPDVPDYRIGVDAEICRPGDPICDNAGFTADPLVNAVRLADNLAGHSGKFGNRHGTYWDPELAPIDEYTGPDGRRQITVAKEGDDVAPIIQEFEGHTKIEVPVEIAQVIEDMVDHGTPGSTPTSTVDTPAPSPTQETPMQAEQFLPPEVTSQPATQGIIQDINSGLAAVGAGIRVNLPQ